MRRPFPLAICGLVLFGLLSLPLYAAIGDNLVSCWALNETAGGGPTTRNDSAASNNHLTDNNTTASAAGKISNAADFESTNTESLSHASNASLVMGDIDFTICAWANLESDVGGKIVNKDDGANPVEYSLDHPLSGDFRFILRDAASNYYIAQVSAGLPSLATWYFVCGGHDATANTAWISSNNGTVVSVSTGGAAPSTGTADLYIGALSDGMTFPFDGLIDEVAIWKRKLSGAEITDLYNSGNGRACSYIVPPFAGQQRIIGGGLF